MSPLTKNFGRTPRLILCALWSMLAAIPVHAEVDEDQLGAWYMYFFNAKFADSQWGLQGDVQYRAWDWGSDMEQLLLRGGVTWRPKSDDVMFTLGYANITSALLAIVARPVTRVAFIRKLCCRRKWAAAFC